MDSDNSGPRSSFFEGLKRLLPYRRRSLSGKQLLQDIIDESEEEGLINEEEGEMLQSIIEFKETIVREIIVPRTDMVCCSLDDAIEKVVETILASGHSRLPVYEGTVDRIVGLVYAKDLLRFWGKENKDLCIESVMRSPFYVPETKKVEELLREFRSRRVHIAIAIDEYGGTSGLITFEDLIEEIVGDIQDEYDLEEDWLVPAEDGSVMVDARLSIDELEEHFDVRIDRDKFDSVGGFLFNLLGRVPQKGEEIVSGPLRMQVLECDERKIHKVRIEKIAVAGGLAD